jgi:hypothetical protein
MKSKSRNRWKTKPWNYHHGCNGNCSCNHVAPDRMERILSHVFITRRMPELASVGEQQLIYRAKLVMPFKNGSKSGIQLSPRGEEVLLDLLPD